MLILKRNMYFKNSDVLFFHHFIHIDYQFTKGTRALFYLEYFDVDNRCQMDVY